MLRNIPDIMDTVIKEVNDSGTQLCLVCLSPNRKLSSLGRFQSVFQDITNDLKLKRAFKIMVCWECVTLLKKVKKFKENVKKSQILLKHLAGLEITAKPLSNLMVTKVTTTDSNIPIEQTKPLATEVEKNTSHVETFDFDSKESVVAEIKEEQENTPHVENFDFDSKESVVAEIKEEQKNTPNVENFDFDSKESVVAEIKEEQNDSYDDFNYSDDHVDKDYFPEFDSKESVVAEIKEEQNDSYDDFNYSDDHVDEDYFPEDVKDFEISQAEKPESLLGHVESKVKLPRRKQRHKRYYKRTLIKKFKKFRERIPILPSEVNIWKKKERNSKYFRRLKHKCGICLSAVNKQVMTVAEHKQKYHNPTNRKYQCDICNMCINKKSTLRAHISKHYYKYRCTLCGYESYNSIHLHSHIKQGHKRKRIVKCLLCLGVFKNVSTFTEHYKVAHTRFECDYCNKICKEKRVLEKHIFNYHMTQRCDACNISFKNYKLYTQHVLFKHTVQPSEATFCVPCNRQFDNMMQYKCHIYNNKAHAAEMGKEKEKTRVPCPECPNVYATKLSMEDHYRMVHLNQSNYHCDLCNKYFVRRRALWRHRRFTHEGHVMKKDKICYFCGKGFAFKTILVHHIRTHTGERPHACPHCDAKFAQKVALTMHIKFIHLKAKRGAAKS